MNNPAKNEPPLSERKTAILTAAANLFAEHGYAAVSLRDLAREVHTTPAALYHHFADKDAIYVATLNHVFSGTATAMTDLVKGSDAPEVVLERLIVWLTRMFSENRTMTRLLQLELLADNDARMRMLTEDVIAAPFRELESLIHRMAPDQDANLSAVSILSLVLGFAELSPIIEGLTGQPTNNERILAFAEHAKQLVLYGLPLQPRPQEYHS